MTTNTTARSGGRRAAATLAAATLALTGILSLGQTGSAPTADAASKVPNVKALAGDLAKQKLTWEACDYQDPSANERFADIPNVQCATVKVPRDWHNPGNGKTWDIRISHAKNIDAKNARYKGTIFVNPGGPGGSGLPWAAAMQERTPDLNPYYNYVGFDPRGVGQSSHAQCTWTWTTDDTDPYASVKAGGKACAANEDVKTINTEQTTYDMDFIRSLLGAPKLSYIGYSYGTWLGAWYEKVFGAKYGDKFVLDSSTDVTDATLQQTWDMQPVARDRQFKTHLMNWMARQDATYKLGTNPQAIHKKYLSESARMDPGILTFLWGFLGGAGGFPDNSKYPTTADVVTFIIQYGAQNPPSEDAKADPAGATLKLITKHAAAFKHVDAATLANAKAQLKALAKLQTVDAQLGAEANAFEARTLTNVATAEDDGISEGMLDDPFDMIRCNDGQWIQGKNYWDAWNAKMKKQTPLTAQFGMFDTPQPCAYWRTNLMMPVADKTFPNTIVVQGEQDSQTAWETGYTSGTQLPNTSFIAIDNEGSHGHFPYGTEAVDRPIYNYFLKGTMPKDIKVAQALPLPMETTTYQSWKKLGPDAKHQGSLITDPFTPAGKTVVTSAAKAIAADNAVLAAPAQRAETEKLVKEVYGQHGVKVLRQNTKR